MAKRDGIPHPKLSIQESDAICREFVPIGDQIFRCIDALKSGGFSAFVPSYEFGRSFCRSKEDLEIHNRCLVEKAKNLLGRPWPLGVAHSEDFILHESPYIKQLSDARDRENGVPLRELDARYPGEIWRHEIDPCERRRAYASIREREPYGERAQSVVEEQKHRFESEVAHHATGLARNHTFDQQGRYAFFTKVMERDAAALGFHHEKSKSSPRCPIFSKPVSEPWDLCLAIEEPKIFFWNPFEGSLDPCLELRHRRLRGSIDHARSGEFLGIRYQRTIPGFVTAYRTFFDLDQLETAVRAHLYLYGLMAPIIEGGIKKVLGAT